MFHNLWQRFFPAKPRPEIPQTIFLGLIGGVGDLVLAAPCVEALKKKFPGVKITFGVGDTIFYQTLQGNPFIDKIETPFFFNVWKNRQRQKMEREKSRDHDWVLLLDNANREWWKEGKHLIDIYQEKCGVVLERRRPVIYLDGKDEAEGQAFLDKMGIEPGDTLIVLSPEVRSKREMKEWPHRNFQELIRRIRNNFKVKIITFVSRDSDREYDGTICIKGFPMRPSAAVIRKADLYLGLDNGLTHIAAGFDVNMISIHIGFPVECSQPISPYAVVIAHEPFCPPDSITVDEVYEKVKEALTRHV
ncbi:MAG: hypothetical protein COV67_06855 [Nitrospinae bacterium CG11_big_fil_rev_8_21_14_0_20_56_8]|nr:MAG: hypothetical protein COV67_06855 [Nitrospinae bacterium CG11_big_fil_rev_8_21_14_0_20_56_8]